jgi:hypothetical protein
VIDVHRQRRLRAGARKRIAGGRERRGVGRRILVARIGKDYSFR